MGMQIDYRDTNWLIEGETVSWWAERNYWRCSCWEKAPPGRGEPPSCYHTRVVSDAQFLKVPIEESGPKIVSLKRNR